MTMTEPATQVETILTTAASLLDSVGAAADTPAEVVLSCLLAAEHLECAGGRARRVALIDGEPEPTIRAAMTALSQLDPDTFGTEHVLAAARAARDALRWLG